uniref:Olduvai domain-containing protein n=1 Tax=Astyanax mexicanus TaxID=7994 RepID=A0A3B1K1E3_ASTMX
EGQGLAEVKQLVEQKRAVERELWELKAQLEKAGFSTFSQMSKFDALIQAQARELSHLRQRMREGRGVCHILNQHLGDTTKAFEELLRANDIDYYMGQSFRDQLAQSSSLAQRVAAKISSREYEFYFHCCSNCFLFLLHRLSKELQQKDKLIESLRSKLDQQQPRPDTPASSHALSEATDQSERTSFISDEQGSTNEDLELCSELDAASEFSQVDAAERSPAGSFLCCVTGTDLMEEHLREIRSLRRRLEDSIQTNDRLRQQLEDRLASMSRDGVKAPHSSGHGNEGNYKFIEKT